MSHEEEMAEWAIRCSRHHNLDKLFGVLFRDQPVSELRRHLLDVYFHSVNAILSDGAGAGTFIDALCTLQNLIEAISAMEDSFGSPGLISLTMESMER